MSGPTHILIANPVAQSGRNAARIELALWLLKKYGLHVQLIQTSTEVSAVDSVRNALSNLGHENVSVISMGGDGTFREVAQGIMESGRQSAVTLGMLPAGTANNHAQSFGLDSSAEALEKNIAILVQGRETQLDVGRLEMRHDDGQIVVRAMFIDSVGFGIGARVIARRHAERRRFDENSVFGKVYRDKRVYTVATLQALSLARKQDEFGVTIVADGETKTYSHLTELLVKGTRVYAGSWIIDRTSRHDDGLFEVVAYTDNRRWVAKGLAAVIAPDALTHALHVVGFDLPQPWRASRLSIEFHVPEGLSLPAVQVDGELFPVAEHVEIEVIPRALRLIVP